MPGPCGDPLGESERDIFSLGPLLEALREFLWRAEEAGVERGAGAFREAVGLHPLSEQPVPVTQTKLTGAGLFHESLADEVLHDARHETGAGLGAWNDLRLRPSPVAIREQASDYASALAHEDVSRLQFVGERAAGQRASIHQQTGSPKPGTAVQVDGGDTKFLTGSHDARGQLRRDDKWPQRRR